MPKECYTKQRKDKSNYTTCVEGQDKPKKKKFKVVPKKTEEPKKKKFKIVPKKTEEPKKKMKVVMKKGNLKVVAKNPEQKEKVKELYEKDIKVGVKPVSSLSFEEIAEANIKGQDKLVSHAVKKWRDSGLESIGWIKGITYNMADFYGDNIDKLKPTKKTKERLDKIKDKVNVNINASISDELKKQFRFWKDENKGKEMTIKNAIKSFGRYAPSRGGGKVIDVNDDEYD